MPSTLPERRTTAVAYLLWAAGLAGVCGLQRFYARKPVSGTLWLLTFGLCGVGQLVDLLLIPDLVDLANRPLLPQSGEVADQPPLDRQLLRLARKAGAGGFTINDALIECQLAPGMPRSRVREEIERLLHEDLLDVGNDDRGRVVYREP